jgi:hypothetical protein
MSKEDLFTPIHKGIRSVIYDTGTLCQTTDFADRDATGKICSRLESDLKTASSSCALCFLKNHSGDENNNIFNVMQTYVPELVETLLSEHEEIEREIEHLSILSKDLQDTEDRAERIAKGVELNRKVNDLFAYYITHMNKEEVTILPATQKYFSDEQLGSIRSKIVASLPPERVPIWIGWIAKSLNVNEQVSLLKALKSEMPSSVFQNILGVAQKSLQPDQWQQLRTRLES